MARLNQSADWDSDTVLLTPQYRNALGEWDEIIDGETGQPIQLALTKAFLDAQSDPSFVAGNLARYMEKLTGKASILERRIW